MLKLKRIKLESSEGRFQVSHHSKSGGDGWIIDGVFDDIDTAEKEAKYISRNNYKSRIKDLNTGKLVSIYSDMIRKPVNGCSEAHSLSEKNDSVNVEEWRREALKTILKYNPMMDDYHTGIRTIKDIHTLEESLDEEPPSNPDVTERLIKQSLSTGEIKIYSSDDIKKGTFVSTSKMMARDYAGSADNIKQKLVSIWDVAWINCDEGQYIGK